MYCPRCKSKLYPIDDESMNLVNVCSYCSSTNKELKEKFLAILAAKRKVKRYGKPTKR